MATWEKKADALLETWSMICKGNTFTAFCRRSGHWKVKNDHGKRIWMSWNEQIQNLFADKMGRGFDAFEDGMVDIETNTIATIQAWFKALENRIEGKIPPQSLP